MKIAILTSGILPVPAVQGGAVENLIDFYLEYNCQHHLHDITVYSVWNPDISQHPALLADCNHYKYIDTSSLWAKIRRKIYGLCHRHDGHCQHGPGLADETGCQGEPRGGAFGRNRRPCRAGVTASVQAPLALGFERIVLKPFQVAVKTRNGANEAADS